MRTARLIRAAIALMVTAVTACSDTTTAASPDPTTVPGTIGNGTSGSLDLATVNGMSLPYDVRSDPTGKVTITQGALSLANGSFQQSLTIAETPATGAPSVRQSGSQGTFTVTGARIVFRATDGGQWEGTIGINRIDYTVPGNSGSYTFSFRR